MICVSIAEKTVEGCLAALKGVPFAEVRLDAMDVAPADAAKVFASHRRLIATCRPGGLPDGERKALLLAAVEAGAAYVDVEVEAEAAYRKAIVGKARSRGCKVIVSYHNNEETPERAELEAVVGRCFDGGADIAKIACTSRSDRDNARLLGLLDRGEPIVVVAMGEKGKMVRVVAPFFGSPFTFASLAKGRETADGQIDRQAMEGIYAVLRSAMSEGVGA